MTDAQAQALLIELWHRAQGDKVQTRQNWIDDCTPLITAALAEREREVWEKVIGRLESLLPDEPMINSHERGWSQCLKQLKAWCRQHAEVGE